MNIEVNILAVILAGIASMAVGFLWYSPLLFAKPWMKLMGYTDKSMKQAQAEMGKTYAMSFIASLVSAYVLYHVMVMSINYFHYAAVPTGVISAFWMWFGFVAPVQMTDVLFGKKTWTLFGINTGYQLASLLVMGLVMGYMM